MIALRLYTKAGANDLKCKLTTINKHAQKKNFRSQIMEQLTESLKFYRCLKWYDVQERKEHVLDRIKMIQLAYSIPICLLWFSSGIIDYTNLCEILRTGQIYLELLLAQLVISHVIHSNSPKLLTMCPFGIL